MLEVRHPNRDNGVSTGLLRIFLECTRTCNETYFETTNGRMMREGPSKQVILIRDGEALGFGKSGFLGFKLVRLYSASAPLKVECL